MLQHWPRDVRREPLLKSTSCGSVINQVTTVSALFPNWKKLDTFKSFCCWKIIPPTDKLRIYIRHANKSVSSSEDLYFTACFMFLKNCDGGDLCHAHVAGHLLILLHTICFSVERFQVFLIPYLISHRKQFIKDIDLNHLDSCGARNLSFSSFIFGKCFNGISKLCYYEVLMERWHLFLMTNDINSFICGV